MTDGRHRGGVQIVRVGEYSTLFQQARQAVMVLAAEAQEVIVAELVDDDSKHQAGFAGRFRGSGPERGCDKKRKNYLKFAVRRHASTKMTQPWRNRNEQTVTDSAIYHEHSANRR